MEKRIFLFVFSLVLMGLLASTPAEARRLPSSEVESPVDLGIEAGLHANPFTDDLGKACNREMDPVGPDREAWHLIRASIRGHRRARLDQGGALKSYRDAGQNGARFVGDLAEDLSNGGLRPAGRR